MAEFVTLGAARVTDPETGDPCPPIVRTTVEIEPDTDDREDFGDCPMCCALGVTALPAPATDAGHAEGVRVDGAGETGAIVGARDTRSAGVVGELSPGDTAVHGTHENDAHRARLFCKDNLLALLVGNDVVFSMDRGTKVITLAAFGQIIQVSDSDGVKIAEKGGAWQQMNGGKTTMGASSITLAGSCVLGSAAALPPAMATPLVTYLTALEAILVALATAIDAKLAPTPGVSVAAVNAFISSGAASKALIPAIFTKVT